jgi:tryptophan halogenase
MRRSIATHVGVIGGGTAGYFAALALRKWFPDLKVTLVESSRIPIIGVGEATTPPLVAFLHGFLGLDVHELYKEVLPTWKLGIHFEWGAPGGFNYPFSWGEVGDAWAHDGSIERASFGSLLMTAKRAPMVRADDDTLVSLLSSLQLAYHLDNRRFVRFLATSAARAGIVHVDAEIADAVVRAGADGEPEIDHLIATDGRRLAFDFVIDCTGFRSLLVGKALASPFCSYADTLFCDRALVADVPHDGTIKPYTLAETMDHGWCWNIPMRDEDHRGYVYSSAFCTDEEAAAEMRAKNPGMSEPWSVKFRSGRREDFWRGNCVAIGNAYGFVEPLESTALHMVIVEVTRLIRLLDGDRDGSEDRDRATINRRMGAHWDYLRWFLGIHYRFNQRLDTPFWQLCRRDVNISGLADAVDDFRLRGPLSSRSTPRPPDAIFSAGAIDIMLVGQRVPTAASPASSSLEAWTASRAERQALLARAVSQRDALTEVDRRPELLDAMVSDPGGWCASLARQL